MVSTQSLLYAAASEVTLGRVTSLIQQAGPEVPTIEYKEKMANTIAKGVVAMANTYGGLMLVGVGDDRKIVGVGEKTIEAVAEHCSAQIEPPWVPEIIPVAIDAAADKYLLVLRMVPGSYPSPLLHRSIAYVRHQNTTHPADWQRLRELCAQYDAPHTDDPWITVHRPDLPKAPNGSNDTTVDFVLKTGLSCPVAREAQWRPMAERDVDAYIRALQQSPLNMALARLSSGGSDGGFTSFERHGLNRSDRVQLRWWGAPEWWPADVPNPVEAVARLEVPGGYGNAATRLTADIEIVVRLSAGIKAMHERNQRPGELELWRIAPRVLGDLLDALLAALSGVETSTALGLLAGIDAVAVPKPRALHLVTARPITETIYTTGLKPIPDAGISMGAHVLADPAIDLADPGERRIQVDRWLEQIALDAGLTGMQRIIQQLAAERS